MGMEVKNMNTNTAAGFNILKPKIRRTPSQIKTCKEMVSATARLFPIIIWEWDNGIATNISPVFLSFSPTMLSMIIFPNNNRGKNSKITSMTFLIICNASDSPAVS